ncbi:SET domain-containing protein [Lindgomyces ingoldianus]|uniref:SET domain-containing protein n=1 Tax=Lindgomyces ingoldianus TaxID=673940 RepID=A0ACB6QYQ9_9PLEO|nr:SET domain-containing protein [Lindgomyces ingoldianus]KAF2471336.1 SET domain-containing protein [Lindgomyces ingoldianus]
MSDSESEQKSARLKSEPRDMKLEEGGLAEVRDEGADTIQVKVKDHRPGRTLTPVTIPHKPKSRSASQSPVKQDSPSSSASGKVELEEVVGGDITLKMEPGKAPRLSRTASQKVVSRPPPLFLDLPDATETAKTTFKILPECTYGNKTLGTTEHALECDCAEEWGRFIYSVEKLNRACGDDSDCINRATKMECVGDCSCGSACQNQRFQRKQYADVTVIKTDKKGYGLRANADMKPGDFVFEYIGEVINEANFRRRMIQYDEEGIKHFYFMSLTKGEFVDATKKGNLGRFCNHSCNPNCYVDKWVVGDKLRMGIFAERKIRAGEELVFNYNVDRYGADPQPCYCDEPNCTGFIGGKTQTERATKLSHATIEALGIDDGEGWDTAVAKKPRKKKANEDDEEYVNEIQPRSLEEDGVTKVMGALNQCKEKWIAVKLLSRIQRSEDEAVGHRVLRMHGYNILGKTITAWKDDFNVVSQVLDILHKLPRVTRNKIHDSGIEATIKDLTTCGDERVEVEATRLLEAWSKLTMGYRIPRVKRDPNAATPVRVDTHFERREKARERSRSRSKSPAIDAPKGPSAAPSGPRFNSQKNFLNGPRAPPHRPRQFHPLPPGWSEARHPDTGALYYYNGSGHTQWQRPTLPAQQPPPPPPKAKSDAQRLQDIISSITKNATPTGPTSAIGTPQRATEAPKIEKKSKSDKWKDVPQEKKEKYYENVVSVWHVNLTILGSNSHSSPLTLRKWYSHQNTATSSRRTI